VFVSSEVAAEFLKSVLGWNEVPVVHYAIDFELFKPRPKLFQIAYMPRKFPQHANFIQNIWNQLPESELNLRWIAIDGISESATAAILGESAFFLSMSYLEGFGLPPLEAMACRCIVVGYHGYGGREYATSENGYWCEEGNPVACLQMLRRVVALARGGSPEIERVLDCASKSASLYTARRQESEILQFAKNVLAAN
jgi:glycogen synthase